MPQGEGEFLAKPQKNTKRHPQVAGWNWQPSTDSVL